MIPVFLLRGVEPVTAGKPVGGGRADAMRLLPQLDPGEILSARVEAKLPDGSYKVLLAGRPLRMALPSYIAPGDALELTFVTREPRLTFTLKDLAQAASASAPQPSAAGRPLAANLKQSGGQALPSPIAPGDTFQLESVMRLPGPAVTLKDPLQQAPAPLLSAAGRLVASIMLQPGELALPVMAAAAAPLLAAPPANAERLSRALAHTLADSGLFYESHQAEWVGGRRELAQIREEPQARLAQGAQPAGARAAAAAATIELPSRASTPREQQTVHPRTVPLVQQQLLALDSAKVVLQLEIWPRQWMQWEIEDRQHEAGREPGLPQCWNTQLRLELPQLGELKAALTLGGDGVRIKLEVASAASAALLREHRSALHTALAAAGLPPAGIAIAQHEQN